MVLGKVLIRPRVSELQLVVFNRALHPELLEIVATRTICQRDRRLIVHITPCGHALAWERHRICVTETIATASQELPECGRRLAAPLGSERRGRCEFARGYSYQFSAHVEVLPPELFPHVHEELRCEGERKGWLFHFHPHNRLGLSPLGIVVAEVIPAGLSISSFHTFPEEHAVLKTVSLIEAV